MDSHILELLLKDQMEPLLTHSQQSAVPAAITALITQYDGQDSEITAVLEDTLHTLTLYYLGNARRQDHAYDPVMHFHLSNGASLDRINVFANMRDYGIGQSWGCMVNYRYESSQIVTNHEAYAGQGKITMSGDLQRSFRSLDIETGREN